MKDIKFTGIVTLEDKQAREFLEVLETRIQTINERTKRHTLEIKKLMKEIGELRNEQRKNKKGN